jgi:L-fuculose-phosphate aldolase
MQSVGQLLEAKGLICATDGNLSIRDGDDGIIITAAGAHKGDLAPEDLIRIDLKGNVLWGSGQPSSESAMHTVIYGACPGVGAVVHAHPPVATAYAVSGTPLETRIMPESVLLLGEVPLVPYATPGTAELSRSLEPYLAEHKAFLLAHHGTVTIGRSIEEAYDQMTRLEHAAKIQLLAKLLGGAKPLSEAALAALFETYGRPATRAPSCRIPVETGEAGPAARDHVRSSDREGMDRKGGVSKTVVESPSPELARLIADVVMRRLGGGEGSSRQP